MRPLIAAFLVFVLGVIAPGVALAQECHPKSYYLQQCQAYIAGRVAAVGGGYTGECRDDDPMGTTAATYTALLVSSDGFAIDQGQFKGNVCEDLCKSSAPFTGWMDYSGNLAVACKEGCAYAATEGESGSNDQGQQRYIGVFTPMGRSCTDSEKSSSGTPAIGDPPPSMPPDQPGDGGNGTGDQGSGTGSGSGSGNTGGNGTGTGTGDGSGSGNTGTGGNNGGTGTGNTGGNTGGSGSTGGGGTGSTGGGSGTGSGSGNCNPASGSSSGGSGCGTGNGGGTGTGSSGNGSSGNGGGTTPGNTGNTGSGTDPAGSSSSASPPKGSYSGSDCNSPPACTGDAVMCGAAIESHNTRCAIEKAFNGTGDVPKPGDALNQGALTGPDVDVTQGVQFDDSGMGLDSTCPFRTIDFEFGDTKSSIDYSFVCEHALAFRLWIMATAAMACYFVMVGNRDGRIF